MNGARCKSAPLVSEAAPLWGGFFVCARNHPAEVIDLPCPLAVGLQEKQMSHKYKVHQLVRITHPNFSDKRASSSGIYEVTRLMPADQTGEVSYRIKSSGFGERAVRESEIAAQASVL
jgi:hypothetical protein